MSSACFTSILYSELSEDDDNHIEGWYKKLYQETHNYYAALNNFRIKTNVGEEYKKLIDDLNNSFKQVSTELTKIIEQDNKNTLDIQVIPSVIAKLEEFDASLLRMQTFVRKYTNKLEYFFLKIQGFFNSIFNCLLNRSLSPVRTIYGEHFAAVLTGPAYFSTPRSTMLGKPEVIQFFKDQVVVELNDRVVDVKSRKSRRGNLVPLPGTKPNTIDVSEDPKAGNENRLPEEQKNNTTLKLG